MKRVFIVIPILLLLSICIRAQSFEEGKQQFIHERYTTAETTFHNILASDPANSEAWTMLVRTYLQLAEYKQALDSFALAPNAIKSDPYFYISKGALALFNKDSVAARSYFEQAVDDTKGKNAQVLLDIADVNIESANGDYTYAIDVLQKAIKRNKKNASLYSSLGKAYRRQHNGAEAYKSFMEAIDKNPGEAIAYYELGELFLSQKNADLYTQYFEKAIAADPHFGPAYYEMYDHLLRLDPPRSKEYFFKYAANSDHSVKHDYSYTDLLYLTKKYDSAIQKAKRLILTEGNNVQPRLYKLISYSLQELGDTTNALDYMIKYFDKEVDSNFVIKDYETMGLLYASVGNKIDSSAMYFEKALELATDAKTKNSYYEQLANLSKEQKDYTKESYWRKQIYTVNPDASNVVLFNWGLAAYRAQNYHEADSVFGLYADKYTDQGFGYYWRARSNAAMDSAMEKGFAVPYYLKLVEVIKSDTLSDLDKRWMKEAYGYLGSYEANTEKDYGEAKEYLEKLLELDPSNEQVVRNIEILNKTLSAKEATNEGSN